MCSQMLCEVTETRIGHHRNLLHVLVMVMDKPDMGHQRAETIPARKSRRIDDQAGQIASSLLLRKA